MDQAILVALVMLVCVLTMLVLGEFPSVHQHGLATTIAMLFVLPFENAMGTAAQKVFYRRQFLPSRWQIPFSYWRGIS